MHARVSSSIFSGGSRLATCVETTRNAIRDLSPLTACVELVELDLRETPIADFSPLLALTNLRELEMSDDQLAVFCRLPALPSVWDLEVTGNGFSSFESFPAMPNLRRIRNAEVESLAGIERFRSLQNISGLGGEFDSLSPLSGLKHLTHLNASSGRRIRDLAPLGRLYELRSLWLSTDEPTLDLAPLTNLPALHDVAVRCEGKDHPGLAELRADLPSWDVEFLADCPRYTPSSRIEVVSQETFDYYDTKARFGVVESARNHRLIESELEWLDDRISSALSSGEGRFLWWGGLDLEVDEDYSLPFRWAGGRSRTLMLHSRKALKSFASLVGAIQDVLALARHDWIIYLQTDIEIPQSNGITAWIYPDRVQTTAEYESEARKRMR